VPTVFAQRSGRISVRPVHAPIGVAFTTRSLCLGYLSLFLFFLTSITLGKRTEERRACLVYARVEVDGG